MDDFDVDASSSFSRGVSAVFAAAAVQRANYGESIQTTKISTMLATENDYKKPEEHMLQHNEELAVKSDVLRTLNKNERLKKDSHAFEGAINADVARKLYVSVVNKWSTKSGQLEVDVSVAGKGGSGITSFPGFTNYPNCLGDLEHQKTQSAVMNGMRWIDTHGEQHFPELKNVVDEVKGIFGTEWTLYRLHFLRHSKKSVLFEYHKDSREHAERKPIDMTAIMELSDSGATWGIAGVENPYLYKKAGTIWAFDSDMWHRSGVAHSHTIKIAFFFIRGSKSSAQKTDEKKKDDEQKTEASVAPSAAAGGTTSACDSESADAAGVPRSPGPVVVKEEPIA